MKNSSLSNWQALLIVGLGLTFVGAPTLNAETFITPTSVTNRLIIRTNEYILIDTVLADWNQTINWEDEDHFLISKKRYYVNMLGILSGSARGSEGLLKTTPCAIAGPAEFITTNRYMMHFTRQRTPILKTVKWERASTNTPTISVPKGRTIQFCYPINGHRYCQPIVSSGKISFRATIEPGNRLEGPLTFSFPDAESWSIGDLVVPEAFDGTVITSYTIQ